MAGKPKPKLNEQAIGKLKELADCLIEMDDEEGHSLQLLLEWHDSEARDG